MCGICGAALDRPGPASTNPLLRHGRPARTSGAGRLGVFRDEHAALGFRRLSIVDLSGGHQPLSNEDGTVWTVFNGEIYNFPALRRRLEARGHTLRSAGDTEVLVHLYEDEGPGCFPCSGDVRPGDLGRPARRLVLGRDRLGQKPLLYRLDDGRIVFASELKSLLALPETDLPRRARSACSRSLSHFRLCSPSLTILEGVHQASPRALRGLAGGDARADATGIPTGTPRSTALPARTSKRSG